MERQRNPGFRLAGGGGTPDCAPLALNPGYDAERRRLLSPNGRDVSLPWGLPQCRAVEPPIAPATKCIGTVFLWLPAIHACEV